MGLFKSKYEKELDGLIAEIDMNMNNNYKDNAQAALRKFETALDEMSDKGQLNEKAINIYRKQLNVYKEKLKGYTHKDQLKNWG